MIEKVGLIILELIVGFTLFWMGQFAYQKAFRRIELNVELFVKDNVAVAISLVGYYMGIVIALGGVLGSGFPTVSEQISNLINYGFLTIILMLVGAWIGEQFILKKFDGKREIIEERNLGAASVEGGIHIANGLILSTALGGQNGNALIGLICWLMGLIILIAVSWIYPLISKYNVFGEIQNRNNHAAGVALAGLLIATGNIIRVAYYPEFQNWNSSFTQYIATILFCLILFVGVRWIADLVLVPGVKISDEIVNQETPNLGVGFIEAFSYIAASFLITWCF